MGFFKTPRAAKKRANNLIDVETFLSPGRGAAVKTKSKSTKDEPATNALAPPLFHTINDAGHQLLKNPKGTATFCHESFPSVGISPSSVDIGKSKFQLSVSDESKSTTTIPEINTITDKHDIGQLLFNGSDSAARLGDVSCHYKEVLSNPPQSPANSAEMTKNRPGSFRSPRKRISLKSPTSTSSPNHLQRDGNELQRPQSFRSISSLQRPASLRSLRSDDEAGSFIEEYVIDDETYYEEEIIEEEFELSMLNSSALLLVQEERKMLVKFDEYDEMQLTLNLEDYTDNELKRTWYKCKDYNFMMQEARQVALKEESRRQELQVGSEATEGSSSAICGYITHKSELEARGLEAWSPSGALQVRKVKELAIEVVWEEQHRQWEAGVRDSEQMRQAYQTVSLRSQKEAEERAMADQQIVQKMRQLEELSTSDEVKKKRRRASTILAKSKTFLNKSVKVAGKVARETGKRSARAGVGAVTLDPKMLLEAIKIEKKKRESSKKSNQQHRQTYKQPSVCAIEMKLEASSASLRFSEPEQVSTNDDAPYTSIREKGVAIAPLIKARADKLKILRVLPLPGTKKLYNEDRREKKVEDRKRKDKKSGLATWEVGLAAGGKL